MGFTVSDIVTARGRGSYYYEDVTALQGRSVPEDDRYSCPAGTPGFRFVREPAEVVSIGLVSDGRIFWGDAVSVSYAGKAGRQGLFRAVDGLREVTEILTPWITGRTFPSFRAACAELKSFSDSLSSPLHVATLYGVSQAFLAAAAGSDSLWRQVGREWNFATKDLSTLPLQGSCGNNFYGGSRKMIAHRVDILPHAQVDDINGQIGPDGSIFLARLAWLRQEIAATGDADYRPVIHLDVHGALGKIFSGDIGLLADFLGRAAEQCPPLELRVESPLLGRSRQEHAEKMSALKSALQRKGVPVLLVIDEWANTLADIEWFAAQQAADMIHIKTPDLGVLADAVDAVQACRRHSVKSLFGGSCIETDLSVRAGVAAAMVARPDAMLARPGMGIDEGLMLVGNEMARIATGSRLSRQHHGHQVTTENTR
jgi:methylaspartate ammonia-lyase